MSSDANIVWQRGVFNTYYSMMKIRVGSASQPIDLLKGDSFEFDGTVLKYSGHEVASPSLRGAFKNGWVSINPPVEFQSVPSVQNSRNIATSRTKNTDLSNVQRNGIKVISSAEFDEETVMSVRNSSSSSEGDIVGRVRTPSHLKVENILDQNYSRIIDKVESSAKLGNAIPTRKTASSPSPILGPNGAPARNIVEHDHNDGVNVGSIRKPTNLSTGSIDVKDTSNINNKAQERSPGYGQGLVATSNKTSSSDRKQTKYEPDPKVPVRIRIARAIDPSFPSDWKFDGKLAERAAAIKAHGETEHFILAVHAAEGDQMRKYMEKTWPEYFAE